MFQFFPETNEVIFARQTTFEGCSLKLDYLTKPSLFKDFGITTKVKMADRVQPRDELFLIPTSISMLCFFLSLKFKLSSPYYVVL
jgi:hypothetical protein